jgi:hypothetical protein
LITKLLISLSVIMGGLVPPIFAPQLSIPATAKCPQWWGNAVDAGWRRKELITLDFVMWRESRCDASAFNPKDPNGGSRGLVQINGFWTPYLRSRGVLKRSEGLFNPDVALRSALEIFEYGEERYGHGWGPWNL